MPYIYNDLRAGRGPADGFAPDPEAGRGSRASPPSLAPLCSRAAASQMLTTGGGQVRMERAQVDSRLQELEAAAVARGYHSWGGSRRRSRGDVKKLRCLVIFCLLLELALAFPVLYLLDRNLRCRQPHLDEVPNERNPELQRLQAVMPSSSGGSNPDIKPRVHLTSPELQQDPPCGKDILPSLHWRNDRSDEENQIKYESGYLTAPKDGDYFVYAQLTFLCPDGKCEEIHYCNTSAVQESQIQQVVTKISPRYGGGPKPILKASSSIGEKDKWKKTLYLGGVIPLRKDDQIMVNVSNPELVDGRAPETSFFGAFLI